MICEMFQSFGKTGTEMKEGIEPAPLDLKMPSALLRASQPATLPLSYVAGVELGTDIQYQAP